MRLAAGYQLTQALHVVTVLGIPELLADSGRVSDELAEATGADKGALYRVLRALAGAGVLEEAPGQRFALTQLGAALLDEAVRARLLVVGRPYHWNAWGALLHSVRTGENAFRSMNGCSVWEYRSEHPEESTVFDAWMAAETRVVNEAILTGYDFGRFRHVVDVGGGNGAFLEAVLARNPRLHGTLFDQPHVIAGASSVQRCDKIGGSFFEEVPRGADAYTLKSVIHDWGDAEATAILRTVAGSLDPDGRVIVVERDLADPAAAWVDLQMLVMAGGQERTEQEYASLFVAAGLRYVGVTPVSGGWAVYEACPV